MVTIVMISGSLRTESANSAALRAASHYIAGVAALDGQDPVRIVTAAIDDIPPYNEDVEDVGWPHAVQRLQRTVADADALFISTPEYNGSMPGVLKNALDWLSRPYETHVLRGKAAVTMSASPSAYGAKWAQDHLRHVLETCEVRLVNREVVTLPRVDGAIGPDGEVRAPEALAAIRRLADQLLDHARRATAAA